MDMIGSMLRKPIVGIILVIVLIVALLRLMTVVDTNSKSMEYSAHPTATILSVPHGNLHHSMCGPGGYDQSNPALCPYNQPSPSPSTPNILTPAEAEYCHQLGGKPGEETVLPGITPQDPGCANIPYYGTDGMIYYGGTPWTSFSISGILEWQGTYGVGATQNECSTGMYPMANPGVGQPGHWNAKLEICQP